MNLPHRHIRLRHPVLWGVVLTILLSACARQTVRAPTVLPPLAALQTAGATHYRINAAQSHIRFLVYKAGPLAAFGHNHVIRASGITGDVYLNPEFTRSGFAFSLPVAGFVVDEPAERQAAGPDFESQPSPQAIAGTRKNMLGPALLDATHYPEVKLRSVRITGTPSQANITLRIILRGQARDLSVPVKIEVIGGDLVASGAFDLRQTDFGITPFSILGGGLQVADTVHVIFHISAQQIQPLHRHTMS